MRAKRKLTQYRVDSAKAEPKEYTLWDVQVPGFGLRIRPTGARAYVLVYRAHGYQKVRRYTIGKPGALTVEEARRKAKQLSAAVSLGSDPAAIKLKGRRTTVEVVFDEYDKRGLSRCSSGHQVRVRGMFRSVIIPKIGTKAISGITRSDVRDITDQKIAKGKKAMANNIHRAMSAFLTWCIDREFIAINPLYGSDLPWSPLSRDRVLTSEELVNIWRTCDQLDIRWCAAIRLLILTGQRRSEVLGAKISEFNFESRSWIIPSERTKNRFAHTVPLSPFALEILEEIQRFTNQEFLFQSYSTSQPRPVTETTSSIRRLKRLVLVRDWRLHDLRRSVATHMAKLKIPPHIIEVVLNHRSGFRRGVSAIYNRYEYEQEARDALNLWANTLKEWLETSPDMIARRLADQEEVVL